MDHPTVILIPTNHRYISNVSITTIPEDISAVMVSSKMDKLTNTSSASLISCDKCQNEIQLDSSTCDFCSSKKRKHETRDRDSEEVKRRYIPSPAASSPALSPKSFNDFDPIMDLNDPSSMSQEHAVFIGPTTEFESSLFSILDMSHLAGQTRSFVERGSSLFALDHELAVRSQASRIHAVRKIMSSVGSFGPILIDAYEQHVHNSFPVVSDEYLSHARHGVVDQLEPTLLAAIYAVAVPWIDTSNPLSASNLDTVAFGLFTKMLPAPSVQIIQAGLLLMQRPDVDSKTLNSQVIGAAYEIGLHLDCSNWTTISDSEKSLRRRLAWALCTQDTWCSLIHGRPAWIDKNNWAVRDLSLDDMNTALPTDSVSSNQQHLFLQLVSLTKILASILETFYTLKAMQEIESRGRSGTRLILEKAKPVQLRLKNWFSELPQVLKMDSLEENKPMAVGLLHLAYFATEISLHRCIIRSLEASDTDAYLAHICRAAAKTRLISAMDFVNRLRPAHLMAFWYFPAPVSFALIASFGSLLLATAPSAEEQEFYQTRLNEYRWTVSVSSPSVSFLSLALETLDQGERLLRNLPPKPPSSEIAEALPEPITMPTGFGEVNREEYSGSDDSGETMDMGQPHATNSGLMSPSASTEDGVEFNRGYSGI